MVLLVAVGSSVFLSSLLVPDRYERTVSELQGYVSGVPDPIILGAVVLGILAVWISAMVLLAKAVYWSWKQVDEQVLRFWALIRPESPILRLGLGLILMMFLFLIGPLFVLQWTDFFEDDDDDVIEDTIDDNSTDNPSNETVASGNSSALHVGSVLIVFGQESAETVF